MRKIPTNRALTQASTNAVSLPAECSTLNAYVVTYRRLGDSHQWGPKELAIAQQLAEQRPVMRQRWVVLSQPANPDQIATMTAKMVACFPNHGRDGVNAGLFAETIIEDIAAVRPSIYVLQEALRAVRYDHEFLTVHVVMTELKNAKSKARWQRWRLNTPKLDHDIVDAKQKLGLLSHREAERERDKLPENFIPMWVGFGKEP
jgi:hypothetical protein